MARPLLETLHHVNGGTFLIDGAEQLAELVKAVDATGKAGTLTIQIVVRKASSQAMAIRGKITTKLPPSSPLESLMFPTPEGNLLTEDPRQAKLPLTAVPQPEALPVAAAPAAPSALPVKDAAVVG